MVKIVTSKIDFLQLRKEEKQEYFQLYSEENPTYSLEIVEKDFWVCWTLKQLFEMPDMLSIAFKGGTSLSKVYGVIDRFSEDIDITIDYNQLPAASNPSFKTVFQKLKEGDKLTNSERKNICRELDENVSQYIETIKIYLEEQISLLPDASDCTLTVDTQKKSIRFFYPKLKNDGVQQSYMLPNVLIEFGGRNSINPNNVREVSPYLSNLDKENIYKFPDSRITVLSAHRTFWEKATLIHSECNRESLRESANRQSRHWYDLMKLGQDKIGQEAIKDLDLMKDVVKLKKVFFHNSFNNFDLCLSGEFKLIPDENGIEQLRRDFAQMCNANYIIEENIHFDNILKGVKEIETSINQVIIENIGDIKLPMK